MNDRPPERDRDRDRDQDRGKGREGPAGTEFLDLEISKVLYSEAQALTREAVREMLKDAIKARLRQRLGAKLDAIALIAADELADDVEANLAIEAAIGRRNQAKRAREEAIQSALFDAERPPRNPNEPNQNEP